MKLHISFFWLYIILITLSCTTDNEGTNSNEIVAISIISKFDDLCVGSVLNLEAVVTYNDNTTGKETVNWSIGQNGSLSRITSETNKLRAHKTGTIIITAEKNGVVGTKQFNITEYKTRFAHLFASKLINPKIVFSWLVLVYTKVDIPASPGRGHPNLQYSLDEGELQKIVSKLKGFEEFTSEYTNEEIGFNLAVVILDERFPLEDFYWHNEWKSYEWLESDDLTRELNAYVGNQTGWYDNVHIFYPMAGNTFGPRAAYGGGAYLRDNITRSQQNIRADMPDNDYYVGMWHESIHGLEVQYWWDSKRSKNCYRGLDPIGNDIELHGQPAFGYMGNDDNGGAKTQNYFQWMADLTTGNIKNLNQVGWQNYANAPNTNLGFGKNGMYQWGPVRYEYEFKPGGPFEQN